MNGHFYHQGYPGFSSFSTEPLGDHHSGSAWIQTTEGQQNFLESIPMSRMSQGAAVSGIEAQLFPHDFQEPWNTQHSSGEATMLERWFSQSSVEAVGSPPMSVRTVTSDHPDQAQSVELRPSLSQMSFPISSGHSDITDPSFNLPDAALYPNSPPYTDVQVYSESAYLDEMDASAGRGSFHNGLPNDSVRRRGRLVAMTTGSYTPFTSSGEEVMFTSPRDVMSQAFFEHSISQDDLSPTLDPLNIDDQTWPWDGGNEQSESGVSSPFTKDNAWSGPNVPNYTTSSQPQRYVPPILCHHTPPYIDSFCLEPTESPRSLETAVFPWMLRPHTNMFQRLPECIAPQLQGTEATVMEALIMSPTPVVIHFIRMPLLIQMDCIIAHGKTKIQTATTSLRS